MTRILINKVKSTQKYFKYYFFSCPSLFYSSSCLHKTAFLLFKFIYSESAGLEKKNDLIMNKLFAVVHISCFQ